MCVCVCVCVCVGVQTEAAVLEQAGGDTGVDQRQPSGGPQWRDWLREDHSGEPELERTVVCVCVQWLIWTPME